MKQTIALKNGGTIPRLGQGTWYMGEKASKQEEEIATLETGISLGLNLIDTAEMYGNGCSEELVGQAIGKTPRESLFLVSKVFPHNAGKKQLERSLQASLKRMKVDYLDLYLLHWRGSIPLSETVSAMEEQVAKGVIKRWGVSNFDTNDMKQLLSLENGNHCAVNQVLYHLGSRGIEFDLLPLLQKEQIPVMAYCPLAQAGSLQPELYRNTAVLSLAEKYQVSPGNILLNFVLSQDLVMAIPKSSQVAHVQDNAKAWSFSLTAEDLELLSQHFPKPKRKVGLDIV